jgi:hypothetical protein
MGSGRAGKRLLNIVKFPGFTEPCPHGIDAIAPIVAKAYLYNTIGARKNKAE